MLNPACPVCPAYRQAGGRHGKFSMTGKWFSNGLGDPIDTLLTKVK